MAQSLPSPSDSAPGQLINLFLFEDQYDSDKKDLKSYDQLIELLERKRKKQASDVKFLKTVFYKTHHRLLRDYDKFASLSETLTNGNYGCLTGTAIYALILEHFEFTYEVLELPNHVFLQVHLDNSTIYFESTLPANGFIVGNEQINEKVDHIVENSDMQLTTIGNEFTQDWNNNTYIKKIGLIELSALQNFNESIKNFNNKDFRGSIDHAVEAYTLYPSSRNRMLMQLVLNKVRIVEKDSHAMNGEYLNYFRAELMKKGYSDIEKLR